MRRSLNARPQQDSLSARTVRKASKKGALNPHDHDEAIVNRKLNVAEFCAMKRDSIVKNNTDSSFERLLDVQARGHLLYKHASLPTLPHSAASHNVAGLRLFRPFRFETDALEYVGCTGADWAALREIAKKAAVTILLLARSKLAASGQVLSCRSGAGRERREVNGRSSLPTRLLRAAS